MLKPRRKRKSVSEIYTPISKRRMTFPVSFTKSQLLHMCSLLSVENYPEGWPQLAAFQHSNDNFAIFRRFGLVHCRLLVQLEAEIALLEHELSKLDQDDAIDGSQHAWRLRTAEYKDDWDPSQRDIRKQLQDKVLAYGEGSSTHRTPMRQLTLVKRQRFPSTS
jgi:hypothetical protein